MGGADGAIQLNFSDKSTSYLSETKPKPSETFPGWSWPIGRFRELFEERPGRDRRKWTPWNPSRRPLPV